MMLRTRYTTDALALAASVALTVAAHAAVTVDNPLLPSLQGGTGPGSATDLPTGLPTGYLSPDDVHAMFSGPGLSIVLSQVQHAPFSLISRTPGPEPGSQIETFHSTLDAMVSINGGPAMPFHAEGPTMTKVLYPDGGGLFGTFDTEMLSLDLVGVLGPFTPMIRESPTLQSQGQTLVQPTTGGFHVDSFFDVFTELSLDGGASWMMGDSSPDPGFQPTHVELNPVPEPGTLLWGAAMGLVAGFRRARSRRA